MIGQKKFSDMMLKNNAVLSLYKNNGKNTSCH